ncbi:MAG: hypothetical protein WBP45_15380 [Daejeonella sp.]
MINKVEFKKAREFGELISDSFLFIKQNFKPLLNAFFYLCGVFMVFGIISAVMQQMQMAGVIRNPYSMYSMRGLSALFGWRYVLVILFSMLSHVALYLTVISFVALYIQKGNIAPTVEEVWVYFKYYFFKTFGSSFVIVLFMILCFACCIIPGIYVFPAMSLFYPVLIIENGTFSYSFKRAFKLLKEEWWVTAAVLLVIWIITYIFMTIISAPALVLGMINTFTGTEKTLSNIYAIVLAVSQYLALVFIIIPVVCGTMCYFNLVERKENTGLMSRMDSLGKDKDNLNPVSEEY